MYWLVCHAQSVKVPLGCYPADGDFAHMTLDNVDWVAVSALCRTMGYTPDELFWDNPCSADPLQEFTILWDRRGGVRHDV